MIHCAWLPLILEGREHLWRACCFIPSIEITKAISLFTYTENTRRKTILDKSRRLTFIESWKGILPQLLAVSWFYSVLPFCWHNSITSNRMVLPLVEEGRAVFTPSFFLLVTPFSFFCTAPHCFFTLTHRSTISREYGRLQWMGEVRKCPFSSRWM